MKDAVESASTIILALLILVPMAIAAFMVSPYMGVAMIVTLFLLSAKK